MKQSFLFCFVFQRKCGKNNKKKRFTFGEIIKAREFYPENDS